MQISEKKIGDKPSMIVFDDLGALLIAGIYALIYTYRKGCSHAEKPLKKERPFITQDIVCISYLVAQPGSGLDGMTRWLTRSYHKASCNCARGISLVPPKPPAFTNNLNRYSSIWV